MLCLRAAGVLYLPLHVVLRPRVPTICCGRHLCGVADALELAARGVHGSGYGGVVIAFRRPGRMARETGRVRVPAVLSACGEAL